MQRGSRLRKLSAERSAECVGVGEGRNPRGQLARALPSQLRGLACPPPRGQDHGAHPSVPAQVIRAGPSLPRMRSWTRTAAWTGNGVRTDRRTWDSRACGPPTLLMPTASQGPLWTPRAPFTVSLLSHQCHPEVTCLSPGLYSALWGSTGKVLVLSSEVVPSQDLAYGVLSKQQCPLDKGCGGGGSASALSSCAGRRVAASEGAAQGGQVTSCTPVGRGPACCAEAGGLGCPGAQAAQRKLGLRRG